VLRWAARRAPVALVFGDCTSGIHTWDRRPRPASHELRRLASLAAVLATPGHPNFPSARMVPAHCGVAPSRRCVSSMTDRCSSRAPRPMVWTKACSATPRATRAAPHGRGTLAGDIGVLC
jgi:hypothetical protein